MIEHTEIEDLNLERLSTCSLTEACALWNEGFKGYPLDISFSLDDFVSRLHKSGASVEKSLVARSDGRLVGFLLNAFRTHAGKLVAWNGGTGVIPEFRGRGVGRILVEEALKICKEEKVDCATLEAISTNIAAIALYERCGYEKVADLTLLQHDGTLDFPATPDYVVEEVRLSQVSQLEFYESFVPWQAHWQSVAAYCGHGVIVSDQNGGAVGYALFRRQFDDQGKLQSITLHQCVAAPSRTDNEQIVTAALTHAFAPLSVECHRSTHNFNKSNRVVLDLLERSGFTLYIEQVLMNKDLTL